MSLSSLFFLLANTTITVIMRKGYKKAQRALDYPNVVSKLLPSKIELLPPRPNEHPFYLYSNVEKLKALGFKSKYDIREGLKKTIDWMLKQNG